MPPQTQNDSLVGENALLSRRYIESAAFENSARIKRLKIRKDYNFFSIGSSSNDIFLFPLPAGAEIISCWVNVVVAFAGLASCSVSVGPDTNESGVLSGNSVIAIGIKTIKGADFVDNRAIYSLTVPTTIQARMTGSANLNGLTAGVIDFYFIYLEHL
ncbi:MAG: hypothetical protein AAB456_01345 [Patescibacteria group bacterium]